MAIVMTNESTLLLEAIRELAEYRRLDPAAAAFNVGNSFYAVNEQWRRAVDKGSDGDGRHCYRAPETAPEIMEHYRRCEPQVEQQVFATYGIPGEIALRERITRLAEPRRSVLDFGAGIGSQLLPLFAKGCVCTHADVGGVMMRYAAWRYHRVVFSRTSTRGPDVSLVELRDDYMERGVPELSDKAFDLVICTEVIEHVQEPEDLIARLATWVKPGGLLVATTSFDDGDGMVPMHLNITRYDDETFARDVVPKYGFARIEDSVYRKSAT